MASGRNYNPGKQDWFWRWAVYVLLGLSIPLAWSIIILLFSVPALYTFYILLCAGVGGVLLALMKMNTDLKVEKKSELRWGFIFIGLVQPTLLLLGFWISTWDGEDSKAAEEQVTEREAMTETVAMKAKLTDWRSSLLQDATDNGWGVLKSRDLRRVVSDSPEGKIVYLGTNKSLSDGDFHWQLPEITRQVDTWNMDNRFYVGSNPWHFDNSYQQITRKSGKLALPGYSKLFLYVRKVRSHAPERGFLIRSWIGEDRQDSESGVRVALIQTLTEKSGARVGTLPANCSWNIELVFSNTDGVNLQPDNLKQPFTGADGQAWYPGLVFLGLESGREITVTMAETDKVDPYGVLKLHSLDHRFLPDDGLVPQEPFKVSVVSPEAPGSPTEVECDIVITLELPEAAASKEF